MAIMTDVAVAALFERIAGGVVGISSSAAQARS
jgi:hypothetical protein